MVLGTIHPARIKRKENDQLLHQFMQLISLLAWKKYGLILAKVIWNRQLECIENYISCSVCNTDDFQQN